MNYFRPQTFNIVFKTFLVDHYEPSLTFIKLNLLHIFAPCGAFNRQLCLSGRYKFYAKAHYIDNAPRNRLILCA